MITKLLTRKSSVLEATAFLAIASLVSRIFGVVRDQTLAIHLGAGDVTDAYFAAFKIPDLIFQLLILGAISSAFIPVFIDYLKKENGQATDEAWGLVNSLLNFGVILLTGLLGLAAIFAPTLAEIVAPGFDGDKQQVVINLMRVMLLSPFFFGISNLAGGILNSFKNFWAYSIAPILYNLGIIIGIIYLVPHFGYIGLAYGVVLGAFMHMVIQIPSVLAFGYRYRLHFNLQHPALQRMAVLMLPRIMGIGVFQINVVISTAIATTLGAGSVAVLNYADNLYSLPISIFGISFAVAIFPFLAEKYSLNQIGEFKDDFVNTLRQILFFIIPTTMIFWLLRAQFVRLIYGYGEFAADWDATRFTVSVLAFLTFGMVAGAVIPLLARSFYALQDTKTPLLTSCVALVVNVSLALWLVNYLSVVGLAAALSASALVNMVLLLWLFAKRLPQGLPWREISWFVGQSVTATLVMGGVGYVMLRVMNGIVDTHTVTGLLLQTVVTALMAVMVYLALAKIFRIPEIQVILKPVKFLFNR